MAEIVPFDGAEWIVVDRNDYGDWVGREVETGTFRIFTYEDEDEGSSTVMYHAVLDFT